MQSTSHFSASLFVRNRQQVSPEVIGRLVAALEERGVELINDGLYVGAGGPGLRLKKEAIHAAKQRKPAQTKRARRKKAPRQVAA